MYCTTPGWVRWWVAILIILIGSLILSPIFPPAHAKDATDTLVIGVFPRRSVKETIAAFTPLQQYLQKSLHRKVRLEAAPDFEQFWQRLIQGRYDLVHYNQYHYVRTHRELGYRLVGKNEENGGSEAVSSINVLSDSGITRLQDLKGHKILFGGGPMAMMSYLVPTFLLRQAGLSAGSYQEGFARNSPNALIALYLHQGDAAAIGDSADHLSEVSEICDIDKFRPLAVSQPLAHLPWAVKPDMSAKMRIQIQAALLGLNQTDNGRHVLERAHLSAIVRARDSDYDVHRTIIKKVLNEVY